jgi:hypothetical protein
MGIVSHHVCIQISPKYVRSLELKQKEYPIICEINETQSNTVY